MDLLDFLIWLLLSIYRKRCKNFTEPVRILSIGVGLGQEPYSIAMILEDNRDLYGEMKLTIDGVDIVTRNLLFAEVGIYDHNVGVMT